MERLIRRLRHHKASGDPPEEHKIVARERITSSPDPPKADADLRSSGSSPVASFPDGAKVLHDCADAAVDICFVHGLTGDRESTWTAHGQSVPWPAILLPPKLSKARIVTYGYDAYLVRKGVAGSNRLIDHAMNLLHDLTTDRDLNNVSTRPLIFVAHSLGGLVCKKAILLSRNHPEPHIRGLFNCIRGIIFMSTPHKGSWMANWSRIPAAAVGLVKSTNKSLLEILETDNQLLESIQVEFLSMVRALREGGTPFEVTCFYEELPLCGVGDKVVSKESATFEGYDCFTIHANHSDMVKFVSEEENGFKRLLGVLVRWTLRATATQELPRTSPPSTEGNRGAPPASYHQTVDPIPPAAVAERTKGCLTSLAFPHMQDRFHDIDSAVAGTCEWLLQHETYKTWAACDHGLLWVKGKPGTGKSTLVKYALGSHRGTNNTLVLSFFFHGRGDELQRTPLGLFRSLLHQILAQAPNALHDLVDRFESRRNENGRPGKDWNWREAELKPFLMSSLLNTLKARPIWLFVDALDECGKDNAVRLVGLFKTMLKSAVSQPDGVGRQFHICFSCRHYPILDVDKNTFEICVEDENERDIRTFVYGQLAAFRTQTSSRIPALIMERAAGIFIWAGLVVEKLLDLDREGAGLKKMEATVRSVPPDLDELYRHLIKDMDSASLKLVQLICFATRPLSVDELQWAMVIDADCPYQSLQACQSSEDYVPDSDRMKRRIQTLSRGLAEITQTQVVQFIHQSVKDFFVKEGVLASDGCQTSTEAAIRANLRLAKICIRYLAMEEIGQSIIYNTRDFPFLDYAATSLAAHMKQCDGEGVLQHGLLASFAWPSNALVELWTRVQQEISQYGQSYHRLPQRGNLVHTTAVYGITGLLKAVLEVGDKTIIDKHIDERDMDLRTPLSLAAANGHEAVVELLTGAGKADVEAKDRYGQTPLSWAAANGHHTVVELLVGKGKADVDSRDRYGQTPVSWAAANGNHTVVELLVGKGKADVDSKDRYGHTPLSWAAANGRKTVVEFLVGKGNADVESKDGDGRTPLSLAATNGHQTVVELLVGTGRADVQAKNKDSKTPLSLATAAGHRAVVEFLVDTGRVDVEGKDTTGGTPLLRAAENGHEAVVKSLVVKAKANVEAKDKTGQTPLLVAVKSGHKAVVEFLVNTVKANVNTKDESGSTPLLVAVEGNKQSIIKFLLGTGEVDVDAKDDRGWTSLYLAVKGGHEATVELLLGTGKVDVNVLSNHSWTPGVLLENVHARHEAIVGLLLGTDKVYINTKDVLGQTALFRAVDIESMAIVKSILDTGKADVDSKDNFGRTPLMVAVEKESRKSRGIVKFLLDTGEADVGARSWSRLDQFVGQTVLSLAVIKGHRDIVDLLLTSSTSDAVVDAKDHYGRTPLYLAARGGFKAIVRSLLNTGKVDVHTMDNWGITPLAIAARRGHEAVVQLLVEAGASAGAAEGKSVERMQ